jgi:hypothetical protein
LDEKLFHLPTMKNLFVEEVSASSRFIEIDFEVFFYESLLEKLMFIASWWNLCL